MKRVGVRSLPNWIPNAVLSRFYRADIHERKVNRVLKNLRRETMFEIAGEFEPEPRKKMEITQGKLTYVQETTDAPIKVFSAGKTKGKPLLIFDKTGKLKRFHENNI